MVLCNARRLIDIRSWTCQQQLYNTVNPMIYTNNIKQLISIKTVLWNSKRSDGNSVNNSQWNIKVLGKMDLSIMVVHSVRENRRKINGDRIYHNNTRLYLNTFHLKLNKDKRLLNATYFHLNKILQQFKWDS